MGITRKQVIQRLVMMKSYAIGEDYEALKYAISSLKTDLKYDLMYEGEEVYTKEEIANMFNDWYYTKDEVITMLTELQLEIKEHDPGCGWEGYADKNVIDCIIQEKITSLKEDTP